MPQHTAGCPASVSADDTVPPARCVVQSTIGPDRTADRRLARQHRRGASSGLRPARGVGDTPRPHTGARRAWVRGRRTFPMRVHGGGPIVVATGHGVDQQLVRSAGCGGSAHVSHRHRDGSAARPCGRPPISSIVADRLMPRTTYGSSGWFIWPQRSPSVDVGPGSSLAHERAIVGRPSGPATGARPATTRSSHRSSGSRCRSVAARRSPRRVHGRRSGRRLVARRRSPPGDHGEPRSLTVERDRRRLHLDLATVVGVDLHRRGLGQRLVGDVVPCRRVARLGDRPQAHAALRDPYR